MIEILYDSYSINSDGIHVTSLGAYSTPPKDIQIEDLAGADGGLLVQAHYRPREIPVEGVIMSESAIGLESRIQDFKRALNKKDKELKISDEGEYSTWRAATPSMLIIDRDRGLNYANFRFSFICPDPIAEYGVGTTLLNQSGLTTNGAIALTVEGSYKAEPAIILTLNSFTGAGERSVIIQNGKTLAGITVAREWTAGDEIEIDSKNLSLKLNGTEIDPSGLFPSWEPGQGTLYYNDTFSARNIDILATYTKRKI